MEKRQFDCGYERYSEMFKVEQDSCDGQREIVDNCYSGQFALKISQNSDEYIPVCEGVNFYIPEISNTSNENTDNVITREDITISTSGTSVSVSGMTNPSTEVCILAKQGDVIKYINQYTADGNGNFEFNFNVPDYGEYNIKISRAERPLFNYNFSCYPQIVNELSRQGKTKNNRIRLQLKPMENAKNISFYAKAIIDNEGSLQEEYVLLTGKKVENGVFRVGNELSQGKWQELELYTEYDSSVVLNSISDIYVKANTGSKWIIDDIITDYIGIKETAIDLSESAIDNVIYQNGLRFSNDGQDGKYNTDAKVLTTGTEISGKLNGISVDSTVQSAPQEPQDDVSETLVGCDFLSSAWTMLQNSQKTESSIIMTTNGIAQLDTGSLSTEDRVVLEVASTTLDRANRYDEAYLTVEMFQAGSNIPYHTAKGLAGNGSLNTIVNIKLILPKIRPNTTFKFTMTTQYDNGNYFYKIQLSDFQIRSLSFNDWNFKKTDGSTLVAGAEDLSQENISSVSQLPNYNENSYAVKNSEYRGIRLNEPLQLQTQSNGVLVIRTVNLSNTLQRFETYSNGSHFYYLPYGESDVIVYGGCRNINFLADENVMIISLCYYTVSNTNVIDKTFYKGIDGLSSDFIISYDGNKIYYTNYNDANAVYKYDAETGTCSRIIDNYVSKLICLSDDEKQLVYKYNNDYHLYNIETNTQITIPNGDEHKFNHKGELYIRQDNIIYMYSNGALFEMISCATLSYYYDSIQFAFDVTSNYLLLHYEQYKYILYKKIAGTYTQVESGNYVDNCNEIYLSDDLSEFFSNTGNGINFKTGTKNDIKALYKASDNTYLIQFGEGIALYNPITKEQYKLPIVGGVNNYNPKTKILTSVRNGFFTRYKVSDEKSTAKYMFSFDGKHTWQAYKNGRWITVSKNNKPTNFEMDSMGMYTEEVNNLSRGDFEKLYKNKTDILNLDVAIYMNSNTNELTPVINGITLSTYETDEPYTSFVINNSRYNKDDYTNISSIFPVENLDADSECYYLLYLGSEWIYTYKGGEFIKIDFTSIDIPNDRLLAWAKLKQYAMSARELRNIPSEKLNSLFLNPDYANDEFGVIGFIKSEDLEKNSVVIKLQGDKKYTDDGNVVLEIKMNGNDTKIIDSTVFSKEVIDRFLSWVQNRQNGKGDVFFNFKNNETQYFINYFMIDSIGIFNPTSYYGTNNE
jgi:hypothetical protein